jgi:hypothetical protein
MGGSTPVAPGRIFISYRRQETAYPAAWLYERVAAHFGREQVFKDVDSIVLGDDFAEVIANAVGSCDVLLALIGDRWLMITNEDGRRRLDDPDDFVRLEIETALERNIRVIPVLFEGARLPRAGELPASLAKLVRRQALELSPSRFDVDIGKLLRVLDATLAEEQARREEAAQAAREAQEQARREAEARAAREAGEQAGREEEERKLSAVETMADYLRSGEPPAVVSAEGALRRLAQDANRRVAQAATGVLVDWEAEKQAQREAEDQEARRNAAQAAREAEEQARREQAAQAAREAEEQTRREAEATEAREAEEQARREAEERKLSAIDAVAQELRSGNPSLVASAEAALRRLANDANQRVAQAAASVLANWQAEAKAQRKAEQASIGVGGERAEQELSKLVISPAEIDFGVLRQYEFGRPRVIRLGNLPSESLPVVKTHDRRIKLQRRERDILVRIDTSVAGKLDGSIIVESESVRATTRIRATVEPATSDLAGAPASDHPPTSSPPKRAGRATQPAVESQVWRIVRSTPSGSAPVRLSSLQKWITVGIVVVLVIVIGLALRGGGTRSSGGSSNIDDNYIINNGPKSKTFSAASPWHVQVTGSSCWVAVKTASGQMVRNELTNDNKMQIRASGSFYLQGEIGGVDGCDAVPKRGTGGTAKLPVTLSDAEDSRPFRSPGRLHIRVTPPEDESCYTKVYRSSDGSLVEEHSGDSGESYTWNLEVEGTVWVQGYWDCTTRISGS